VLLQRAGWSGLSHASVGAMSIQHWWRNVLQEKPKLWECHAIEYSDKQQFIRQTEQSQKLAAQLQSHIAASHNHEYEICSSFLCSLRKIRV